MKVIQNTLIALLLPIMLVLEAATGWKWLYAVGAIAGVFTSVAIVAVGITMAFFDDFFKMLKLKLTKKTTFQKAVAWFYRIATVLTVVTLYWQNRYIVGTFVLAAAISGLYVSRKIDQLKKEGKVEVTA